MKTTPKYVNITIEVFKAMNKKLLGFSAAALVLIITVTLLIFVFNPFNDGYVADDKTEISDNIDSSSEISGFTGVDQYLREWGMPSFDRAKFSYFEYYFNRYYAYEGGMPSTYKHARELATLFLENYYDVIDLSDKVAVTNALLKCYTSVLDDPYSTYRPPVETEDYNTDMSGSFGGIGVVVEYNSKDESIRITTVYPDSPAEKCGIKVGDFIYAINGKTVDEIGYTKAVNHIRGKIGTTVDITLLRGEDLVDVTATRALVEEINAEYEIDEENNVGYVRIVAFKANTFDQFKKCIDELEAAGVDGIIFDLRNNPGGYVYSVVSVVSYLIPDGYPVVSYRYNGRDKIVQISEDEGEDHWLDIPFVVICNENTASAGEIFTSAIRDYRNEGIVDATIVGTTTYKKGIMQNTYYYNLDNSSVTFTIAYYDPPCGINYHGIGITPDVVVELDGSGEDIQLDAAYEEISKLIEKNN